MELKGEGLVGERQQIIFRVWMSSKQIFESFNDMLPAHSVFKPFEDCIYSIHFLVNKLYIISQNTLGIHNVAKSVCLNLSLSPAEVQEVNLCRWVREMPGTPQGQRSTVAYLEIT